MEPDGWPQRILFGNIISVIAPTPSAKTMIAFKNSKKKRKVVTNFIWRSTGMPWVGWKIIGRKGRRSCPKNKLEVSKAKGVVLLHY